MDRFDTLLDALGAGGLDASLTALYGGEDLPGQRARVAELLGGMAGWSAGVEGVLVSAPGRTELGGNHTDHNNGVVLAAAVQFDCLAAAAPVPGRLVRVHSEGFSGVIEVDLDDLEPRAGEEGTSAALVRGVAHGLRAQGYSVAGCDVRVSGRVPVGSGLSSSASFEVCTGQVFNTLFNHGTVPPVELARIGRRAENRHFGKPCGFMDQVACAVQGIVSIDFLDQAAPVVTEVDFDFNGTGFRLCVVATGGSHADLTPEYAAIPAEMARAAAVFGREAARGLTLAQVLDAAPRLRREAGDRAVLRLIHFIEENERAQAQAQALRRGDMEEFLALVRASGDSSWRLLQNCVATVRPLEQGIPLALTLTERFLGGRGACRVQGGGFAGTIQAYVPEDRFEAYRGFMEGVFGPGSVVGLMVRRPGLERIRPGTSGGRAEERP
jgi:galactokinase